MAIKTSNQITFTEQKKILEIKEWYLATGQNTDVTLETSGWTEEVQIINETNKYLWNYEEVIYSIGSSEKSEPIIIGFYGKGTDGKGIVDIKNYYFITQNPELPENIEWSETVLMLTSTDKYLWNYDEISYTDGTCKTSEPAIIGVYGDSGADAVDFQIYSVDGFEFNDNLTSIELKTVALQNGEEINSNVSYQWKWWNGESTSEDKYEIITDATSSTLVVNSADFASASLKCELEKEGYVFQSETDTEVACCLIDFLYKKNRDYFISLIQILQEDYKIEFVPKEIEKLINGMGNLGRPHIAKLLMKYGYVNSVQEAFDKYLVDISNKVGYVKGMDYKDCIDLILKSGGIPVLAHPKTLKLSSLELINLIKYLVDCGLKGIEVYHSMHSEFEVSQYIQIANELNLLVSGGSDFHGYTSKPDIKLGIGKDNLKIKKLSILEKLK